MPLLSSLNVPPKSSPPITNPNYTIHQKLPIDHKGQRSQSRSSRFRSSSRSRGLHVPVVNELRKESDQSSTQGDKDEELGVKVALSVLRFYRREISPLLPKSCRYVPSCSEYSMIAYKKYGFVKGSILTTHRICRCNPLGGKGFDPPRWFNEPSPPEQ